MIYIVIGITIIALTNLGTLSILAHYIDRDVKGEPKKSQRKRLSRKKGQTETKKRRRR